MSSPAPMSVPPEGNALFKEGVTHDSGGGAHKGNEFNIFYSNITSFSPHAKRYISQLDSKLNIHIKCLALVEVDTDDAYVVQNKLRQYGFTASCNVPEPTTSKNHGGECLATRRFVNSRPIPNDILEAVANHFRANLRCAAR